MGSARATCFNAQVQLECMHAFSCMSSCTLIKYMKGYDTAALFTDHVVVCDMQVLKADTDKKIKAVAVVHNETATGVTSDLPRIRETMDACDHPALFMVDGVSSIGALDFQMDKWKVDIAVTGSQKALSLPTGLAIVAVSEKVSKKLSKLLCTIMTIELPDWMLKQYAKKGTHCNWNDVALGIRSLTRWRYEMVWGAFDTVKIA